MTENFYAVIPAGGRGTRLWPLSRTSKPKFLLPLPGPRTMIQATVDRMRPLCSTSRLFVVTSERYAGDVREQVPCIYPDNVIEEPVARGSGPAIGLATAIIHRRDPTAIVGSFAADHVVTNTDAFENAVLAAVEAARLGYLVTIGIEPSYPETGYGYIRKGPPIGTFNEMLVHQVGSFREKPDIAAAEQMIASGECLWNSSMFIWSASMLMEAMERFIPDLAAALTRIAADWDTSRRHRTFQDVWPTISEITIDHGILERSDRVATVPGTFGWTDLGDWHGLGRVIGGGTVEPLAIDADVLTRDADRAIVMGRGRLVALLGVDDVVVVDTEDALLVCHRARAQEVRHLVDDLARRGATNVI